MVDVSEVEKRVDRAVTATIPVSAHLGGIDPENYGQVMEFAKTMATCRAGIPKWLRGSVGDCLMICTRALRWGMDPFFVAEKSYLMISPKSGEERISYESQLVHAVIEALAPIKGRLRHEIKGEGDERYCVVWATFKGEDTPHTHTSETLGKRIKDIGKSEKGNFRGSPLWLTKPAVQLFYDASRDWCRVNCPEVLAGVYTRDELADHEMVDVTPPKSKVEELAQRLRDRKMEHAQQGFDAGHVKHEAAARSSIIEETAQQEKTDEPTKDRSDADDDKERGDGVHDRTDDPAHQSGDAGGVSGDAATVAEHAGSSSAGEKDQSEIFPPDRKPSKGKRK
jgi:hypothetical protein